MLSVILDYHSWIFSTTTPINRLVECGYTSLVCSPMLSREELHKLHFKREIKYNYVNTPFPSTLLILRSSTAITCINKTETSNLQVGASTPQTVGINSLDIILQCCFIVKITVLKACFLKIICSISLREMYEKQYFHHE